MQLSVYAGFGSLCIVPQLLFPFLLSEALMGMAFPLFVLMACESDPRAQFEQGKPCTCADALALMPTDLSLHVLALSILQMYRSPWTIHAYLTEDYNCFTAC